MKTMTTMNTMTTTIKLSSSTSNNTTTPNNGCHGDLTKKYQMLFLGTAIYNWFVSISMLKPTDAYVAMNIKPIPAEDNTLHL